MLVEEKAAILDWLAGEADSLRTNRVTPGLVEKIVVEHYGSRTPLMGLASIMNADARTLVISPWDPGAVAAIEEAVTEANLGVKPIVDSHVIRLVFSSLTEEMREKTVKVLTARAEEARVKLRQARDEELKTMREALARGDITEDDFYDGKKKLDKLIDQANADVEAVVSKKKAEILTV